MKNKIKYILAGCCLMTTFSCSDFLERYPLDKAVNDTYWKTENGGNFNIIIEDCT